MTEKKDQQENCRQEKSCSKFLSTTLTTGKLRARHVLICFGFAPTCKWHAACRGTANSNRDEEQAHQNVSETRGRGGGLHRFGGSGYLGTDADEEANAYEGEGQPLLREEVCATQQYAGLVLQPP